MDTRSATLLPRLGFNVPSLINIKPIFIITSSCFFFFLVCTFWLHCDSFKDWNVSNELIFLEYVKNKNKGKCYQNIRIPKYIPARFGKDAKVKTRVRDTCFELQDFCNKEKIIKVIFSCNKWEHNSFLINIYRKN